MKKKILMIDDDPDFLSAVRIVLDRGGYECIEANSAMVGLSLVSNEKPDLILLDVMMEDIASGFRFVKELHEIEEKNGETHTPILMVTSIRKVTNLNFRERMGDSFPSVADLMDKPVDSEILLKRIDLIFNSLQKKQRKGY